MGQIDLPRTMAGQVEQIQKRLRQENGAEWVSRQFAIGAAVIYLHDHMMLITTPIWQSLNTGYRNKRRVYENMERLPFITTESSEMAIRDIRSFMQSQGWITELVCLDRSSRRLSARMLVIMAVLFWEMAHV